MSAQILRGNMPTSICMGKLVKLKSMFVKKSVCSTHPRCFDSCIYLDKTVIIRKRTFQFDSSYVRRLQDYLLLCFDSLFFFAYTATVPTTERKCQLHPFCIMQHEYNTDSSTRNIQEKSCLWESVVVNILPSI